MRYLLIPVYNEEQNLKALRESMLAGLAGQQCFFVFADDGSTDRSVSLIQELFADQKFVVLGDGKNHGPGFAFNTGMEWILHQNPDPGDKVVTMESDNTSDIGILQTMLVLADRGYELVLASPYAQGGGFTKTSFLRKFLSFTANMIFRGIFNIKVLTLSSFYRVYSIALLTRIRDRYGVLISENGYLCKLEVLIKSISVGASVIEVPMRLNSDKRKGKSKMKLLRTSLDYLRFLIFKRF